MGVKAGLAAQGKQTHKDKPTSTLSKQQFVTKPENRQIGTKVGSAESANALLRKVF